MAAVAITLLILGFNFLKGRNLFSNSSKIYAIYDKVNGLTASNPIVINGLQVGTVYDVKPMDKSVDRILVTLNLTKDIDIPKNSFAVIKASPLSTTNVEIQLGNSSEYLTMGKDTIQTKVSNGIVDDVMRTLDPVLGSVNQTLHSLDSVMNLFAEILDPNTKNNLRSVIANLNRTTGNLTTTTAEVNRLLNAETGSVAKTMDNLNSFSGNLAKNNETLTHTMKNLEKATSDVADANIKHTLQTLDSTSLELHGMIQKMNSSNGSLGALINDKKLYNNLESTTRSLNTLLDDFRVHPKRYVHFSVFGKKEKGSPLMAPLPEPADSTHSTINKP